MLAHRLRRWPSIKTTMVQHLLLGSQAVNHWQIILQAQIINILVTSSNKHEALTQCWVDAGLVVDDVPALNLRWDNILCVLYKFSEYFIIKWQMNIDSCIVFWTQIRHF